MEERKIKRHNQINTKELANMCHVSVATIHNWIGSGKIKEDDYFNVSMGERPIYMFNEDWGARFAKGVREEKQKRMEAYMARNRGEVPPVIKEEVKVVEPKVTEEVKSELSLGERCELELLRDENRRLREAYDKLLIEMFDKLSEYKNIFKDRHF